MSQLKYILVDLNSYFASCEQQDNPRLRNKPIAVVPMIANNTSVIAASYQAKLKGIKTGTKLFEAKKLCPEIIFIEGHHRRYTEYHHKIVEAVNEICPVYKVLSIDEMVCQLIGRETQFDSAQSIALKIKKNIALKVGSCLTCSIGISTNILLAKLASDLIKPDGLVIVPREKIGEIFDNLPIQAISGVGRNMQYKLNQKGYYKIGQLRVLPAQQMRQLWGSVLGLRLSQELQGENIDRIIHQSKSISHQHILSPHFRNHQSAIEVLMKLTAKAASRLRSNKQKCTNLSLTIKDMKTNQKIENSIHFQETDDTFFLLDQIKKMTMEVVVDKPIKVSVVLSGFSEINQEQLSLFSSTKMNKLSFVMDLVNQKYGPHSLMPGGFLDAVDQAKTRIAFNHIPKISDEFE